MYLKFIYDVSTVDSFISLSGTGSVEMEYVVVTANSTSNPTVAMKSFIVVSGGGTVSLIEFRLETFKSFMPAISLEGSGSFLADGVVVTNATFTGTGVFVLANYHLCDVTLINSNFNSLTGVNGTIVRIDGANINFSVSRCVIGTSIKAGNGGAFYFGESLVVINSCSFSGCTTDSGGKGGAIYFGVASRFGLVNCTFSSCSATYGGAIFSESEDPSGRILDELNFSSNTVAANGNGNDIADNSTVGISLYSSSTVTNCVSTSTSTSASNFYLFQGSQVFDCLLSPSGCLFDILYVTTTGVNSYTCGHESSPCKSLAQTVYNLNVSVGEEAVVHVASGEYTDTYLSVSSMNLAVLTTSESKPVLSLLTPPAGLFYVCGRFMMLLFPFRLLRCCIAGGGECRWIAYGE
jgi:hypothetical protein